MPGVNLTKGQTISLEKKAGHTLGRVRMGLGWDAAVKKRFFGRRPKAVDLDASALMFNEHNQLVDQVWFRQLVSKDGAVRHTGDNRTGLGEGDDESIRVDLAALPRDITTLVFTVNSFTGQDFSQIDNAFCRLVDEDSADQELARYELTGSGRHNAQVMAKLSREGTGWTMTAIGVAASGRTFRELLPAIAGHLTR